MNPDPDSDTDADPTFFVIDLQDANKKLTVFRNKVFCLLLFKGTLSSFFKDKKPKGSHKAVGIKVFLLFCLGIEGSGSRRSQNIRIRRIRIRIRNTATDHPWPSTNES
jgi:hypothetical protein